MIGDIAFQAPWVLLALPLALLPWLSAAVNPPRHAWLVLLPRDRWSDAIDVGMRLLGSLAMAAVITALAGPYRGPTSITRVGEGAEIVILLDRSRSMDQPFTNQSSIGNRSDTRGVSKGGVARELLARFTAARPFDAFAMFIFSARAIPVLDFSNAPAAIQAAISAHNVGRGLGETDIGQALEAAVRLFEPRSYQGARVVLLVSDGGSRLDPDVRTRLASALRRARVRVYWLYIRSVNSASIADSAGTELSDTVPEIALHRFLESTGVPYHAFEAEDPKALGEAIATIDRMEKHTIYHTAIVPRRELAAWFHALALVCTAPLAAAAFARRTRWSPQ